MSAREQTVQVLDEKEHRYARADPSGCARLFFWVPNITEGTELVRALRAEDAGVPSLLRGPRHHFVKLLVPPPLSSSQVSEIETRLRPLLLSHGAKLGLSERDWVADRYESRVHTIDFANAAAVERAVEVLSGDALGEVSSVEADHWVLLLREDPRLSSRYVDRVVVQRAVELGGSYLGWVRAAERMLAEWVVEPRTTLRLDGSMAALLSGCAFALCHWPFETPAAKALTPPHTAGELDSFGRHVSRRWRTTLHEAGLWEASPWTKEVIDRRARVPLEIRLRRDQVRLAVVAAKMVGREFRESWGEFCVVTPGHLDGYDDLSPVAVDRLVAELQRHLPEGDIESSR